MSLSFVDGLYDGFLTIRNTLNVCSVPSTLFLEKKILFEIALSIHCTPVILLCYY